MLGSKNLKKTAKISFTSPVIHAWFNRATRPHKVIQSHTRSYSFIVKPVLSSWRGCAVTSMRRHIAISLYMCFWSLHPLLFMVACSNAVTLHCLEANTVDCEIFIIKIFCRPPFPMKIKYAKYFVQCTLTYTKFGCWSLLTKMRLHEKFTSEIF